MSTTQVERKQVIESGSPLKGHSLNQKKMKLGDEGLSRLTQFIQPPEQPTKAKTTVIGLPLTQVFMDAMFPFMVETATKRVLSEENLPIPQRIGNTAVDVYRIYKEAGRLGVQIGMVDTPDLANLIFPTRRETTQFPATRFLSLVTVTMNKLPLWVNLTEANKRIFTIHLPRSYFINLTSTDFVLANNEAVKDRVETYGYVLRSIATALHIFPNEMTQAADIFFPLYREASQRAFR